MKRMEEATEDYQEFKRKFGNRVKIRRIERNLSQSQLAASCFCSQAIIQKIETGQMLASNSMLKQLKKNLDVPVDYFLRDYDIKFTKSAINKYLKMLGIDGRALWAIMVKQDEHRKHHKEQTESPE